jgi:hypothetical protein
LKKIINIIIIGILILSGFGAVVNGLSSDISEKSDSLVSLNLEFTESEIVEYSQEYFEFSNDDGNYLMNPGKPMMPKIIQTFELPFGVSNIEVEIYPKTIETIEISNEIRPSPSPIPLNSQSSVGLKYYKDNEIYNSEKLYPTNWFQFSTGCGINVNMNRVTFINIHFYPYRYSPINNIITYMNSADIIIKYNEPEINPFPINTAYDFVIISPEKFSEELQRLVQHKTNLGFATILKTTEDIYDEYDGVDKPEQIKYFIKDAIETWDIKYVLLVGGLNSVIYAKPRDDSNQGSKDWYVPVRYTNLYDDPAFPLQADTIHDPGTICDLYYADIYKTGGAFDDWNSNGDDVIMSWGKPGYENDTNPDYYPDVNLGRLACRNNAEVKTLVDKIITYEGNPIDPSWFEKMIVISGDGFLDQIDWNILWDTNGLTVGEYQIHAQSKNPEGVIGPEDIITITIDRGGECSQSEISFNHDDHLNPALADGYPAPPIAEIVSISNGDILSSSNFQYEPSDGEAYLNWFFWWANISYVGQVLTIRGKSYDPKPYGYLTDLHLWITNDNDETVFEEWRNNSEMYYEGEWVTGERLLNGRGGALYYMPEHFEKDILWASNGRLTGQESVINAINKGSGFLFFSGHGSPNVWADQYPGIPGNRAGGSVTGLQVTTLRPWPPFIDLPAFPMDTLSNGEKLPIAVIGGCHNSQFNVSMILGVLDAMPWYFPNFPELHMWCHGFPVPETFSWRLVRNPNGGAIASMGNTGLGYGVPHKDATIGGGDGWITIEFFKQYGEEGFDILGETYSQTLTSYLNSFDMENLRAGHPKTVQQWALLGDPTLKIGGYN